MLVARFIIHEGIKVVELMQCNLIALVNNICLDKRENMIQRKSLRRAIATVVCLVLVNIVAAKESDSAESVTERLDNSIVIAFGSCNDQKRPQLLWQRINAVKPDVWLWLGDNVYADTENMDKMAADYSKQKSHPLYQKLIKSALILGTWDDHDYGRNDAGKEYPQKAHSQQLFLDFLGVDKGSPRRKRQGVYHSQTFEKAGLRVKFILLDTRYFRDQPKKKKSGYSPNMSGTILGEAQWRWLEKELSESKADVNILASSIQVVADEHRWEKWANFPMERERLLLMLAGLETLGPTIVVSGDRHIGEISTIRLPEKTIHEVTSSSLTHGWGFRRSASNRYRLGKIVYEQNFGLIKISTEGEPTIELELRTSEHVAEKAIIRRERKPVAAGK